MHTSFSGWAAAKKLAGVDSLSEDKESTDFAHFQTIVRLLKTRKPLIYCGNREDPEICDSCRDSPEDDVETSPRMTLRQVAG
jgi:hypothetical protein